jgi:hypothetical protein
MKNLIAIAFFVLLYPTRPFAQPGNKNIVIRQTVTAINTQSGYKVKTLHNGYFEDKYGETPDNGVELKGYYQNKVLKKMVYSVGLSNSIKTYEFYLSGGTLIFVFQKEQDYPATAAGGLDYSKLVPAQEARYYFDGPKIIKTITQGKGRPGGIEQADFLSTFNDLKKDLGNYNGK